jgi:hypothetical protein
VSILRDEPRGLNENTEGHSKFRQVSGWDHAFDGIEVFVGESGARLVDVETEEDTGAETHVSFGGV